MKRRPPDDSTMTDQLANDRATSGVENPHRSRMSHFVETASSNAIFAVIITWLMHRAHISAGDLFSLGDPER